MQGFIHSLIIKLDGRKTHIVAVALAIFNVLISQGVIHLPNKTIALINALLAAAGLSALRVALNK